jgi:hypothetical protein
VLERFEVQWRVSALSGELRRADRLLLCAALINHFIQSQVLLTYSYGRKEFAP